ncbi:MAG: glycosyltransferase family 4 protein [Nitrospirota bacterium]|nr:MAG: glycosyltransferase family 4 protein [Nitrospirota bacterium]
MKILIEASRLMFAGNDGTKRYIVEFLRSLSEIVSTSHKDLEIDLFFNYREIKGISDFKDLNSDNDIYTPTQYKKFSFEIRHLIEVVKYNVILFLRTYLPESAISILKAIKRSLSQGDKLPDLNDYDLIHLTTPQSSHAFINSDVPMVFTLYDITHILFPQYHLKDNIAATQYGIDISLSKKAPVIAISNATKKDLISRYPSLNDRVSVIFPGCDHIKFKPIYDIDRITGVRNKYGINERRYLLSLCTLEPRKNLVNMINAFLMFKKENPDADLLFVIAGKRGWKIKDLFRNTDFRSKDIIFTGFIDENDLPVLYSEAFAFCYVSHYEGFGLPIVEAMSCRTPVIYGNNSSMPEVAGECGLAADPNNIVDIKDKYELIYKDHELREDLSKKALERSNKFSWSDNVEETIDLYREIIRGTPRIAGSSQSINVP